VTGKRTRIINDPSDLVPLLQAFGSNVHKKIFDELSRDWHTERELTLLVGDEASVHRSVALLRKSGLVETKWRVPEPGASPEKEYHSTYSRIQAKSPTPPIFILSFPFLIQNEWLSILLTPYFAIIFSVKTASA
jgi:predicted DNA-binding ArsR family transcriptional regulator